jgi:hypothetical protein
MALQLCEPLTRICSSGNCPTAQGLLQALHKGTTLRKHLHQHKEQMQESAGVRVLTRAIAAMATLTLAGYASPAKAQWCNEPSKPFCMDIGQPDSFCRIEVEEYLEREKRFRTCVVDEANTAIDESKRRAKQIVDKWNCYANGSSVCF